MSERVPFKFAALPDVSFEVEAAGFGWKLYANGQELQPKRNKLAVPKPDGSSVEVVVKPKIDQTPTFVYAGESVAPLPGVPTPLLIVAALPLALVGVGGAIGGALGALAFFVNIVIAKKDLALPLRIVLMVVAGAAAAGVWMAIAAALTG